MKFLKSKEQVDNHFRLLTSVLLDFDGTVVDYYENENRALTTILTDLEVPKKEHKQIVLRYRDINENLWKQFEKKTATLDDVRYNRFRQLSKEFNLSMEAVEFNRQYIENFGKFVVPYPGIVERIEKFRKDHPEIKVIIVTNGADAVQHIRAENTGIKPHVDGIVSSDLVGIAKPSPKIFDYTKEKYNVDLKSSLMVGDSLTSDIQGAHNSGIMNCYVREDLSELPEESISELTPTPDMISKDCMSLLNYISDARNGISQN